MAILVAACSGGGGKQSAPTTAGAPATTTLLGPTGFGSGTGPLPASVVVAERPCPSRLRIGSLTGLNAGAPGRATRMVPFAALNVRLCVYPDGPGPITSSVLAGSAATRVESLTNRLRAHPLAPGSECTGDAPTYFVRFANNSRQLAVVNVCGEVTNGPFVSDQATQWLDELDRYAATRPTGTTRAAAAQCTLADLAPKRSVAMPAPQILQHQIVLDGGQNILAPPANRNPPITAVRAWQAAGKVGLLAPAVNGGYEVLLADLTSIHNYLHRPVWVIIGRRIPLFSVGGGIALPGVTQPPQPPCSFGNTVEPIDAATGQPLFSESGGSPVP